MRVILWLCLALAATIGNRADAACATVSAVTGGFATVTSYDLRAGSVPSISVPRTLNCDGAVITLLGTDYARATATSSNVFRLKSPGGDSVGYKLSADSNGTMSFSQGSTINYLDPSVLSVLTILSPTSFTPTMFAALTESPNVPVGTYTDTVTIAWSWRICHGIGVGGLCVLQETGTGTSTITITLTVTRDCRIVAPAVSFGSAPLAGSFPAVSQAVAVDCTKGTTYYVAFTSGASGASRPWRAMSDGAGHGLQYNLYRPDGSTIWDETNPLPSGQAGTGATTPGQLYPYIAKVNAAQAVPAGNYSDTVSVAVTF